MPTFRSITGMTQEPGTLYARHLKRLVDFFVAILCFIISWPVMLFIYFLLRWTIGKPVLFKQTRPGFKGKPFTIYKFRTMTDQRDPGGRLLPDERRITKIGGVVRSFSLDELPEIFNVFKGDMSFVGPRPLMMQYLDRYTPEQARRHEAMPGITGWVQVNGRNSLTWEEKFRLDVWYVDHQSFTLDMWILALTIWKVIKREGISSEGHATAPEFMGSVPDKPRGNPEVSTLIVHPGHYFTRTSFR